MSSSSHHPYQAHEEPFHAEINQRFNEIESRLDDLPDEDGPVDRDRLELAMLYSAWIGSELASAGFNPPRSLPDGPDNYTWFDRHIAQTYTSGADAARTFLDEAGHNVPQTPGVSNSRTHQRSLERVLNRQRTAWNRLHDDLQSEVRSEARSLTGSGSGGQQVVRDRIEKVGKNRGRMIAQTETARAYNYALISEYEDAGVREVSVQEVDWTTAGDQRVCAACASMAGTYTIREARKMLESGEFPHHVSCRCLLLPSSR